MNRALSSEALGTGLLVATVIGSGIMAERLSGGNTGLALLANTVATGAVLYVLIAILGPISGAQFNPAVTLLLEREQPKTPMIVAQLAGGCGGALLAHLMFGAPVVSWTASPRTGPGQWLGEATATFGLLLTIRLGLRHRPESVPALVAAWIVAAYWFTSSTSFANPAVTAARALTGSFAGIRPVDVPAFIFAQMAGAWMGHVAAGWLTRPMETPCESDALAQPQLRHLAQDAGDP